tara:strand:- start:168 stop:569 length:402 start_codon:yes stop_codon:yes gene_type:complete
MGGKTLIFGAAAILIALIASGLAPHGIADVTQPEVAQPKLSAKGIFGKLAYDKFCAECHGQNGTGTDKGPPFLHRYYLPGHHGDGAFHVAVMRGVRAHHWRFGDMKPVPGVTEMQVDMIVEYVRALQKANGLH